MLKQITGIHPTQKPEFVYVVVVVVVVVVGGGGVVVVFAT